MEREGVLTLGHLDMPRVEVFGLGEEEEGRRKGEGEVIVRSRRGVFDECLKREEGKESGIKKRREFLLGREWSSRRIEGQVCEP